MFCDNSPVIVDAQAIFIPIIIQHTGRRMNCIYIYLLEDGDAVYCLDSLHEEMSQCESRPAQPQTHRSPEPTQQIHLLHDVVLLRWGFDEFYLTARIMGAMSHNTHRLIFDESAELYQ